MPEPIRVVLSGEVAIRRRKVRHWLHFLLTLLTGGLWGFVWIVVALSA